MGKESKLRTKKEWEPRGNNRELYDPDKVPDGCDPDIWHLSLYFVQRCEDNLVTAAGNNSAVIVYEKIKRALTNLPPPDIRTRARTCGITVTWVVVVEKSIDNYFDNHNYPNTQVIEDYTVIVNFDYYINYTIDTLERQQLLDKGIRIPQQDREIQPSKRTEEEKVVAKILQKKRTPEEMLEKMKEFRSRTE